MREISGLKSLQSSCCSRLWQFFLAPIDHWHHRCTTTNLVLISVSVNLFLPQRVKEEERTLHPIPLPPPPDVSAIINCATVAPLCFGFAVQPERGGAAEHCLQLWARRPQRGPWTSVTLWCVLNKSLARTFPSSPLVCTSFSLCFLKVDYLLLQSDDKWSLNIL